MKNYEAFIKRLQEKPLRERKMIVLGSSLLITGIITVIWLSTFSLSSHSGQTAAATTASPASALGGNFSLIFAGIKDFFGSEPKNEEYQAQ